jgi:MraZ protein
MDFDTTANDNQAPSSTFHGSYTRSVDAKGRFALPFRFRQGGPVPGEEKYMVTQGPDGSLSLMPYAVWTTNFHRMSQGKPSRELRANKRKMSLASSEVTPDSQGRVAVPAETLTEYGINNKITVVGMGNYMELWDAESLTELNSKSKKVDSAFMNEFYR